MKGPLTATCTAIGTMTANGVLDLRTNEAVVGVVGTDPAVQFLGVGVITLLISFISLGVIWYSDNSTHTA